MIRVNTGERNPLLQSCIRHTTTTCRHVTHDGMHCSYPLSFFCSAVPTSSLYTRNSEILVCIYKHCFTFHISYITLCFIFYACTVIQTSQNSMLLHDHVDFIRECFTFYIPHYRMLLKTSFTKIIV